MKTTAQRAICPKCGKITNQKGGIHNKTVYDLPILGKQVKLNIKYRNFICLNKDCDKKYISETIPGFVEKFNHRTRRLNDFILKIALATSAEESSRILKTTGIEISGQCPVTVSEGRKWLAEFAEKNPLKEIPNKTNPPALDEIA